MLQRIQKYVCPEPIKLPGHWELMCSTGFQGDGVPHGLLYENKSLGLRVIHSYAMVDGTWWDHISVSRRSKLPSWDDLKVVKKFFIGDDREAAQILPKAEDYVNLAKYCLHLWAMLEGPTRRILNQKGHDLLEEFRSDYGQEGNCSCHNVAPCPSCIHEGNPNNLAEDDSVWEIIVP